MDTSPADRTARPDRELSDLLARTVEAMRAEPPLVQVITNYVSMDLAANLLNAAGASPAMVHDVHEAAEFAGLADAVVANIGTPSAGWAEGMLAAAAAAHGRGICWVLDPVAVGATAYRRELVVQLLEHRPTVIRGNPGEILALSGIFGAGRAAEDLAGASRGVDSAAGIEQATEIAAGLASRLDCVVAVTGASDLITDGHRRVIIDGGDPRAPMITALGCAATALVAACCAGTDDPVIGSAAALSMITTAIERAGADAAGPGSLRWRLLDELSTVTADQIAAVTVRS